MIPTLQPDTSAVQRRTIKLLFSTQVLGGIGVFTGIAVAALLLEDLTGSATLAGFGLSTSVIGGAFTAPLVADRLPVDVLVLVAGMIPSPGESPEEWWHNTGYQAAVAKQAARDGGLTGSADPYVSFYHDVPRELAEEALSKERAHPSQASMAEPWPLDAWPDVPTKFVLCSEDRFFPSDFFRRLVGERLGIVPDEIAGSHCVALSRRGELAELLVAYTIQSGRSSDELERR